MKQLCRWIGPSHGIGQSLCSYFLLYLGGFVSCSSVISIYDIELTLEHTKQQYEKLMTNVESKTDHSKQALFDGSKS